MHVLSVNVGIPRLVSFNNRSVRTGIFKQPAAGRVALRRMGLAGDGQADLRNHGGPDMAVYAFPYEHYGYWQEVTGRDDFVYGQFGENLTVEGLHEHEVSIGDVYQIGDARLQVSQPRVPCYKLGIRLQSTDFVKLFFQRGLVGFYFRILQEGTIGSGDRIECVECSFPRLSVADVYRIRHLEPRDREGMRRAAGLSGLADEWRKDLLELSSQARFPPDTCCDD